jgi:3-phosphoshikimate 1-carboxyvinyltransferase
VIEAEVTRDHTERLPKHFGAKVTSKAHGDHGRRIVLQGQPELEPAAVMVPADPSSAAFPLVAALIVPNSELVLDAVMTNPLRTGLLATLREMGANIEDLEKRDGGEEIADLCVRTSALKGVDVPSERAPSMIDEYPILAVAASFAEGVTRMRGLKELRVKESDRLVATVDMLRVNGVTVEIEGDDLIIQEQRSSQVAAGEDAHGPPYCDGCIDDGPWYGKSGAHRRQRVHRNQLSGFVDLMRSIGSDLA